MTITQVKNLAKFNELIASGVPIVVDFFATWCGPCRMISPKYEEFSRLYTNVTFLKIDVDEAGEVAEACQVRSMPTFLFYKGGKKVSELIGANVNELENRIRGIN